MKPPGRLAGKVAIVTGASQGIGAAIAQAFASEDAHVVISYLHSTQKALGVVAEIQGRGGRAMAVRADVTQPGDVEAIFRLTMQTHGKLDILVNNAGKYVKLPLAEISPRVFHDQFDLNVLGIVLTTQQAAAFLTSGGSILNIASISAITTPMHSSVYAASKAAVIALTKAFALELGARCIRVNAINPGLTDTDGARAGGYLTASHVADIAARTPLRRIGRPSDVASAAIFLASDESAWITGEAISVSGGRSSP